MALASTTGVWEVRTTGSDANGGYYNSAKAGVSGSVDFSQQDTAQLSLSDVVTNGTTTVTSVTGGFTAAMVGNGISIVGTVYEITAVASSTSITVDRTTATGAGQVGKIGGALASGGNAIGAWVGSNTIYMRGSFAVTTATNNVAGGCMFNTVSWSSFANRIIGYAVTRGDGGIATIQASGISSATLLRTNQSLIVFNLKFDAQNLATVYPLWADGSPNLRIENCTIANGSSVEGPYTSGNTEYDSCLFYKVGVNLGFVIDSVFLYCPGATVGTVVDCLVIGSTGTGSNAALTVSVRAKSCTVYGSASHGIYPSQTSVAQCQAIVTDCLVVNCAGYGIFTFGGRSVSYSANNGFYNNASGITDGQTRDFVNNIILSGNPFVNPGATLNTLADVRAAFALNNMAGAGASARGAARVAYSDLGAVQSKGGNVIVIDD